MSKYEARVLPIVEQYRAAHDEGEDMATVIADLIADLLHVVPVGERDVIVERALSYVAADDLDALTMGVG